MTPQAPAPPTTSDLVKEFPMTVFQCPVCDYRFDEAVGDAAEGFDPGTSWSEVPDDWFCPDCGVRDKVDFEPVT